MFSPLTLFFVSHQVPLRDALLLHEVLEDHAQDLEDALGMYSKASSGGAVEPVRRDGRRGYERHELSY